MEPSLVTALVAASIVVVLILLGTIVTVVVDTRRTRQALAADLKLAAEDRARMNQQLEDTRAALHQARAEIANLAAPAAAPPTVFKLPEVSGRKCANCKHFDLEEGHAAIRQHPVFAELARHVSPAKMANRTAYDAEGKRKPEPEQPPDVLPAKAKWADFGACMVHRELRYREDSCEKFEAREERAPEVAQA